MEKIHREILLTFLQPILNLSRKKRSRYWLPLLMLVQKKSVNYFLTYKIPDGIIISCMADYTCPHCQNPIYDEDALLCHFCGGSLERAGRGFLGRIRYSNQKVIWFFIVFFVLFAFVLLMLRWDLQNKKNVFSCIDIFIYSIRYTIKRFKKRFANTKEASDQK